MVVELDQPGADQTVRLLGLPVKLSRTPGEVNRLPGPALGEHTDDVLRGSRLLGRRDRRAQGVGRRRRSGGRGHGVVPLVSDAAARNGETQQLLRMRELAERSGVSAGTIKHYLREGLLGDGAEVVRTSRNMAYYPPAFVERIRLIKRLQEERFMPLRMIREVMERGPEQAAALVAPARRDPRSRARGRRRRASVGARGARALRRAGERARAARRARRPDPEPRAATTPTTCAIIEAIARFREGGYDEALGFTVFDTLRYKEALAPLVEEEVRTLLDRLTGEVSAERAAEIISSGARRCAS